MNTTTPPATPAPKSDICSKCKQPMKGNQRLIIQTGLEPHPVRHANCPVPQPSPTAEELADRHAKTCATWPDECGEPPSLQDSIDLWNLDYDPAAESGGSSELDGR